MAERPAGPLYPFEVTEAQQSPRPVLAPRDLAAAVITAVAFALIIGLRDAGLGLSLAGIVAIVCAGTVRRSGAAHDPWRWAMGAAATALVALPTLTDARWIVTAALIAAVVLGIVALVGSRTWWSMLLAIAAVFPAAAQAGPVTGRATRSAVPSDWRVGSAVRTTVLTMVLVGTFGALFVSADQAFGALLDRYLLPDITPATVVARVLLFALGGLGIATVALTRPPLSTSATGPAATLRGVEWKVPLASVVALFIAFVAVQFGVLFGGHERVLATSGLTYADYAREGFAQLLLVGGLSLTIITGSMRFVVPTSRREEHLRRTLLAALCVLTLVVLASALSRLHLYEEAFGFTRARLSAQAITWWMGSVFVLLLIAGASRSASWLPRSIVLATAVAVLGFGYLQPDAMIARGNVERYEQTGKIDTQYLRGLSADATPALLTLPDHLHDRVLGQQRWRTSANREAGWRELNLSRRRAADLLGNDNP